MARSYQKLLADVSHHLDDGQWLLAIDVLSKAPPRMVDFTQEEVRTKLHTLLHGVMQEHHPRDKSVPPKMIKLLHQARLAEDLELYGDARLDQEDYDYAFSGYEKALNLYLSQSQDEEGFERDRHISSLSQKLEWIGRNLCDDGQPMQAFAFLRLAGNRLLETDAALNEKFREQAENYWVSRMQECTSPSQFEQMALPKIVDIFAALGRPKALVACTDVLLHKEFEQWVLLRDGSPLSQVRSYGEHIVQCCTKALRQVPLQEEDKLTQANYAQMGKTLRIYGDEDSAFRCLCLAPSLQVKHSAAQELLTQTLRARKYKKALEYMNWWHDDSLDREAISSVFFEALRFLMYQTERQYHSRHSLSRNQRKEQEDRQQRRDMVAAALLEQWQALQKS